MKLSLLSFQKLTHNNKHNAFTDLIYYDGAFWCSYRQATNHMSLDGIVQIQKSIDGVSWSLITELSWSGGDMRDPKFFTDKNHNLFLMVGIRLAVVPNNYQHILSSVWRYKSHTKSFELSSIDEKTWRWSGVLVDSEIFSVGYAGADIKGTLYKADRNFNWLKWVSPFFPASECFSNETSLIYDAKHKQLVALVRRDGKDNCPALLGKSQAPFISWHWKALNLRIGGPKLLLTTERFLLAGFRIFTEDSAKMVVAEVDTTSNQLNILLELPSSGDCSYPGMVQKNNHLYISYYSSHDNGTQIYFSVLSIT